MKVSKLIGLFFLLSGLLSCEEIFLGENESNTPGNNFDLLWKDFDSHYALFEVKGINWKNLHSIFRPMISDNTSEQELWTIITAMLNHLNDGHTTLENTSKNWFFESGDSLNVLAEHEFSVELIINKYVSDFSSTSEKALSYGHVNNMNVGYIYMASMSGLYPERIDDIVSELRGSDAIILDIRNNGGGTDTYAHRIAGAFADAEHFIYTVQTRNGPNHNDFDAKKMFYSRPAGKIQYTKPVVVLTDRYTVSAAEIFMFNMRSFKHVTQIGDTTAGDFSDISNLKFLPNGWIYRFSHQLYLTPEGKSLDGIGFAPDLYIKNTKEDMERGQDKVLERAVQYLKNTYDTD